MTSTLQTTTRALVACLAVAVVPLAGCPKPLASEDGEAVVTAPSTTLHLFLGGLHVATIEERAASATVIDRTSRLIGTSDDDVARLRVRLDARGFPREATYQRRGARGDRDVTLVREGKRTTLRTAHGEHVIAEGRPPVLLEVLHRLRPAAPADVVFVDVTSGETLPGSVRPDGRGTVALDEHGALLARATWDPPSREGPGLFLERAGNPPPVRVTLHPPAEAFPGESRLVALQGLASLHRQAFAVDATGQRLVDDGTAFVVAYDATHKDTRAPTSAHRRPAPFFESDDAAVAAFAAQHATSGVPSADALTLASAIHGSLDTTRGGGPPSALGALTRRAGDCDDATALLVASLRARGHAARAAVGYRHHDGKLIPHAWAEVHDGEAWLPVDALVPGLGPFDSHLKLFEGLGSPLTMGRVLGALRVEPSPAASQRVSETDGAAAR